MIVVKLQGGLGNQMFQYAAGRALALRHGTTLKLDLEFLLDRSPDAKHVFRDYDLDIFDLHSVVASRDEVRNFLERSRYSREICKRIRRRLFPVRHFFEPHCHFSKEFNNLPKNTYLEGFLQSPKYFHAYEATIRRDFRFKEGIPPASRELLSRINNTLSVCVNVRRTDFLTNAFHGVCDMRYFAPAMELMRQLMKEPSFFVFSDDPNWCRQNFGGRDVEVVGHEHMGRKFGNYLQLMSHCRQFIIPNSTFAWWATWFNRDGGKTVIAPRRWFADLSYDTRDYIPEHWIRMDH